MEIRERQRHVLGLLLELKKDNQGITIVGLQEKIKSAVLVMDQEDVAWVEKIVGIEAI